MTFAGEIDRLTDLAPVTIRHRPTADWRCVVEDCGTWPCDTYKGAIRVDYRYDNIGLSTLMASFMVAYLYEMGDEASALPAGTAGARFVGWCRHGGDLKRSPQTAAPRQRASSHDRKEPS